MQFNISRLQIYATNGNGFMKMDVRDIPNAWAISFSLHNTNYARFGIATLWNNVACHRVNMASWIIILMGHVKFGRKGNMMRVIGLEGVLLDFWVAKSENLKLLPEVPEEGEAHVNESGYWHPNTYHPSSNWSQGGVIVAKEWFAIEDALVEWFGPNWPFIKAITDTPLPWMMRAYVKTHFGDEVEDIDQ
jgi:hypothetical protein